MLQQFHTAKELFLTDWKIYRPLLKDKIIDNAIWVTCSIFVNAYLLPKFGINPMYGIFAFAGMLASAGMFEGYASIVNLVGDLIGGKVTYYYATLPLPTWLMFTRLILSNASLYMILTFTYIPLGKLLLYNRLDLGAIHWLQMIIIVVVSSLFYGAFNLFTTSFIDGFEHIGSVWARFIFPLWFLGGFAFSWAVLYETTPTFAYIDLLNPILYISEAFRVALMGQPGFLNFWLCITMICVFGVAIGWIGIERLKKRCDFI